VKKNILLFLLSAFILFGCATPPTQQEIASADYGVYPKDYEEIIKSYMNGILKDPMSAQYTFLGAPQIAWTSFGGRKFGYGTCVRINAKNSFGGYTGNHLSYFLIRNGSVVTALVGTANNPLYQGMIEGACNSIGYR
jgi:hypothetical protein